MKKRKKQMMSLLLCLFMILTLLPAVSPPVMAASDATQLIFDSGTVNGDAADAAAIGPLTVTAADQDGNPVSVSGDTIVDLFTDSAGGFFCLDKDGRWKDQITEVTILHGKSSATFYYGDTEAGTATITASATGLADGAKEVTVMQAADTDTITALTALDDSVLWQKTSSPNLPNTLEATVETDADVMTTRDLQVTWQADHTYVASSPEPGLYVFTPQLKVAYTLASGLTLPRIIAYIPPDDADAPVFIQDAEQLAQMAVLVNAKNWENFIASDSDAVVTVKLANDIDLSVYGSVYNGGKGWTPIGTQGKPFQGIFDGQNHTITGLYINNEEKTLDEIGLFGATANSAVKNLTLSQVYINGSGSVTGGVTGLARGGMIENCTVSGIISGPLYSGGISGGMVADDLEDVIIENCAVSAAVSGSYSGGILGMQIGGAVQNCYTTGTISSINENGFIIGGIVGYTVNGGMVQNCYAVGTVTGTGKNVMTGGIVGYIGGGTVQNCYATGTITGAGGESSMTGGITGSLQYGTLQNCAALNPSVSGAGETGRVTGISDDSTLAGNVAFSGMTITVDGSAKSDIQDDAGGIDGQGKTLAELQTASGFPEALTQSPWTYEAGKLPGFGAAIAMPSHLSLTDTGGSSHHGSSSSAVVPSVSVSGLTGITTVIPQTGSDGTATGTVTSSQINDALAKAQAAAAGTGGNPQVEIQVNGASSANAIVINIPASALQSMVSGGVEGFTISSALAAITFGADALSTIAGASSGNVAIAVGKADPGSLSSAAQQVVGNRPVYTFTVASDGQTISQFGGNVTVSIPYTPAAGEDTTAIVIYYVDANGELQTVTNGRYDAATGRVVFTTPHFSTYAVGYHKVSFSDVKDTAWYAEAVNFIAARSIASGTGADTFSPDGTMTRAMLVTLLNRMGGDSGSYPNPFTDVPVGKWYTQAASWAEANGIARGVGTNTFAPDTEVTREQLAVMLYNYARYKGYNVAVSGDTKLSSFGDTTDVSNYAETALGWAVGVKILNGDDNGKLNPQGLASRAEVAAMLQRFLENTAD